MVQSIPKRQQCSGRILAVASEELGVGYLAEACTCIIPEATRKHGGRDGILEKWEELIWLRNLTPCYNVPLDHVPISESGSWDQVKDIIEKVGATDCARALRIVDAELC